MARFPYVSNESHSRGLGFDPPQLHRFYKKIGQFQRGSELHLRPSSISLFISLFTMHGPAGP